MPARPSNLNGALLALLSFGIYATSDVLVNVRRPSMRICTTKYLGINTAHALTEWI